MSEKLQNIVDAAQRLSFTEQLELIEAISRLLKQGWQGLGMRGSGQLEQAVIPDHISRTLPVTDLKRLAVDFWPDDETADDINAFVAQQRKEDLALEK